MTPPPAREVLKVRKRMNEVKALPVDEPLCGSGDTEPSGSWDGGSFSCSRYGGHPMAFSFCISDTYPSRAFGSPHDGVSPSRGHIQWSAPCPDNSDYSLQQPHLQSCRATISFLPFGAHVSSQQADVRQSTTVVSSGLLLALCWRLGNCGACPSGPGSFFCSAEASGDKKVCTADRVPLLFSSVVGIVGKVRSVYSLGILYHSVPCNRA
jgi:hypothetical protein